MVKSSKNKTNKMKMVSGKSNTMKKNMKKNMQKKTKKVLLTKLVTRNKLKKMMKGGANTKYKDLTDLLNSDQFNGTEIDLSYDVSSPTNQTQQPTEATSTGIWSQLTGFVGSAREKLTSSSKPSQLTSTEFETLTNLFRTKQLASNITSIKLSDNGLSSLNSGSFSLFDNVNSLDLSNNNFTNKAILDIFTSSQTILPNLTNLNLSGNPAIQDLTTSLKQLNPSLQINLNMVSEQVSNTAFVNAGNASATGNGGQ
jgi:hypothetical protein